MRIALVLLLAGLVAFLLLAGLVACADAAPPRPGDPLLGAEIYTTYCAVCHQQNGSGRNSQGVQMAADYTVPGGPLSRSDDELLAIIHAGRVGEIGSMPPWRGILSSQRQQDVLAYLRASFAPPPPAEGTSTSSERDQ